MIRIAPSRVRIRPIIMISLLLYLCAGMSHVQAVSDKKAFLNAAVYTMDSMNPWSEAVVIQGNEFIYVGSTKGARALIDEATEVLDLEGRMVLPGLIESHSHPTFGTLFSDMVILDPEGNREQLIERIKKTVIEKQKEELIVMMGFMPSVFGPDGPSASELDALESRKPVLILDYGGHSAWVNTRALQIGGITKETPDPLPGGHYYKRDQEGNPTGWCIEPMSFMPIILKLGITTDTMEAAAERFFPVFSSYGFTTIFDAGGFLGEEMFKVYLQMEKRGRLPFRVHACHIISNPQKVPRAIEELHRFDRTYRSELFRVNTMKILYDGTLEAKSCAMFDGFLTEPENRGFELIPPDELNDFVKKVDDAGFHIHIHAIGNRAISDVLGALEALKTQKGSTSTRKTVCHVQFFMQDTVARFKALENVIAQTTPAWMVTDTLTEKMVGKEIYERQVLFGRLDKEGVRVSFGSDYPISSGLEGLNPFNEMEVGHTRRAIGAADTDFLPPEAERLSIETLLRGYTINGAYQLGVEKMLGSIEKGKLADMIVIEQNLFEQKAKDIHNNRVLLTMMNGRVVYNILKDSKK